jgi:hypothetical protein
MVLDLLTETTFVQGVLWTIYGVGFWVGGVIVAHYVWKRYRNE